MAERCVGTHNFNKETMTMNSMSLRQCVGLVELWTLGNTAAWIKTNSPNVIGAKFPSSDTKRKQRRNTDKIPCLPLWYLDTTP